MSDDPAKKPRLLRIGEVADWLSVSERSVQRMSEDGLLPRPVRLGGSIRWHEDEIAACVRELPHKDSKEDDTDR